MVFSLLNPGGQSYLLFHRFSMPTQNGAQDAIAVTSDDGDKLISAYTFILEHIVMLVWGIAVLIGLLISIRRYDSTHPSTPVSTEIWYKRSSPIVILQLAVKHFVKVKVSRWVILMWIIIALLFTVVKYAIPIIFAPYIKIGNAAPVSPSAIFVPSPNNTGDIYDITDDQNLLRIYNFYVPFALQAVGNVDSLNGSTNLNLPVSVDKPKIIEVRPDGELVMQVGYRYNITGLEFGLQYFPDLIFQVEGSCMTEFSWTLGEYPDSDYQGVFMDAYAVFGDDNIVQTVSPLDGGPRAFFFSNPPQDPSSPGNSTWAAIVSTVNRTSFSNGTDPWYLTASNPFYADDQSIFPAIVKPLRPALSCWENDIWSYHGKNSSTMDLDSILPEGLATSFAAFLTQPMIYFLGTYLQVSALKSSVTALSAILDANSSSVHSDLERLVYASYIASVNCLTATTLFPPANDFPNEVSPDGTLLDGAGDFVIYSNDIATLSVRALIIIPTIAVALWLISVVLLILPIPGKEVASLNALLHKTKVPEGEGEGEAEEEAGPESKDGSHGKKRIKGTFKQVLSTAESLNSQDSINAVL